MAKTPILIVGGGLTGATLALALARNGLPVTLIDALPARARTSARFDGRSYALALSSQRMLQALELWTELAPKSAPILEVKAGDGRVGEGPAPFLLHFDHAEIEEGPMGFMCEDRHLRTALLKAVKGQDNIETMGGVPVVSQQVDADGVTLTLSDGTELRGCLVVGCDGHGSRVAARAGIERTGWRYGQLGLVCAIAHEKPHRGIAHQFFMPSGPLAILPLPGNRSSVVWTEAEDQATKINALPEMEYLTVLRPRFGDFLGKIRLTGDRFTYPLSLSLAYRFVSRRLVLVGDAAHGIHPIAGQGLNLGLRDVGALAQILVEARRRGEDVARDEVLARYERWRRFDVAVLAVATDGFNRLFSNDNAFLRPMRDIGMGLVGSFPALRRRLIRQAAGLTGDLPLLMQGRAL
ncbi:MAG: UbiH/UbiF/VisC/COQ6 family ubiquinone biosynthesis hydroxylase [Pseudomonadota bacterium]